MKHPDSKHINTVVIIAGPTASGKTGVAVTLAKLLKTSVLSADSRQCYHEMNIGTARPTVEEMQGVEHHFIDQFPVRQHISAGDYEQISMDYLEQQFSKTDVVVVCGGTGLYINALCGGLDTMPELDAAITDEVNTSYLSQGLAWLQEEVRKHDPVFYGQADVNNPARLLRALAFVRTTGTSITNYQTKKTKTRDFRIIKVGLDVPRDVLYERINQRVDTMMQQGLLAEATSLYPLRHLKNLQTVGYTEFFQYLNGEYTLAEAVDKVKQHTRNYAKRQLTWFRKDPDMVWLPANSPDLLERITALL